MKKLLSVLLVLCLALALCVPALAASDVVWSQDTTLQVMRNIYDNATVRAGVTLTMQNWRPDPQGLEIGKSLTVEPGGTVTGGSIIFSRGATCSGLDLYYVVAGQEKLLTATLAELVEMDPNDDYQPVFWFDTDTGHYVLKADFSNDPFEIPTPGDGGSGGAGDTRTEQIAEALKSLGLFAGSDQGFELDRAPSRLEEVILLIRLLGREDEALSDKLAHPFTDVPVWGEADNANRYVGYAYANSLAYGTGADKFGTDTAATAQMFCTFVLRALGYNDNPEKGAADFAYADAIQFAMANGLLGGQGDVDNFTRGACVRIMESALRQGMKDGGKLWEKLVSDGVFTEEAYRAVMDW